MNTIQNLSSNTTGHALTGLTSLDSSRVKAFEDERENLHELERAKFRESVKMIAHERDCNARFQKNKIEQETIKFDFLLHLQKEAEQ